jgi:spermidine synthase
VACAAVFAALFFAFVLLLRAKGRYSLAVAFNTGVCGAVLIVVEVVLLLAYQVLEGSVYRQMALLISLFMAGLAAGSASLMRLRGRGSKRLVIVQAGLVAYLGVLCLLLSYLRGPVLDNLGHDATLLLFSALAFVAGTLGGGQFFAAVSAGRGPGGDPDHGPHGAVLYAADLIGASAGALCGSLFLIPVFGIPKTLLIGGLGCLAATGAIRA